MSQEIKYGWVYALLVAEVDDVSGNLGDGEAETVPDCCFALDLTEKSHHSLSKEIC